MIVLEAHEEAMAHAIKLAQQALRVGHRPFGCVITTSDGRLVTSAYGSESLLDPTRHSEMLAIRNACKWAGGLLRGFALYTTHEPCPMCAGAITHSKISTVVFGSYRDDLPSLFRSKRSARTVLRDTTDPPDVVEGVLRVECIRLFDDEMAAMLDRAASA